MDYTKLQNGSDIRGVAMEGIEGQHVNLTEQACRDIGRGFALWLRARLGKDTLRVAVGRDSRLSGPQLALWLMEAMAAEGLQVTDLGMASTPAMFMSTVTEGFAFDASVMITASHLPFNRNGYKFFTKDGGLEKQDIAAILALAGGSEHTGLPAGSIVTGSFMDTYAAQLRKKVQDVIEITSNVPTSSKKKLRTKGEKQQEIARLTRQMKEAAKMLEFEIAAQLRDQIKALEEK